jgi:hypothetical protein
LTEHISAFHLTAVIGSGGFVKAKKIPVILDKKDITVEGERIKGTNTNSCGTLYMLLPASCREAGQSHELDTDDDTWPEHQLKYLQSGFELAENTEPNI